jgi:hypothetical protein
MFGIVVFTTVLVGSMYGIVVLRQSWMVLCLASCFTAVVDGSMFGIVGCTTVVDGSMLGIVALRQSWMVLCLA